MQDYQMPKPKKRGMWPVYGFLMMLACAGFAYVIGPKLIPVARQITRGGFTGNELPGNQMDLAFMAVTFLVLVAVGGLIIAIAMPKKKSIVKETDLRKERTAKQVEAKRRRARALVVEHEIKKENRKRSS